MERSLKDKMDDLYGDMHPELREEEDRYNYEFVLLDRLSELRRGRDELNKQIGDQKNTIRYYDYLDEPFNEKNLKAEKELAALELRVKNLDEKYSAIEKRYQRDYNPGFLEAKERYNPTPIAVPQDQGYEIDNGLLGVKRDLFNKLATHRWADDRDLQQRYEISKGTVPWKNHFTFALKRSHKPKPK
jgi:hypothetical protein